MKKFAFVGCVLFFVSACSNSVSANYRGWYPATSEPREIDMGKCMDAHESSEEIAMESRSFYTQIECDCEKCVVSIPQVNDYCNVLATVEYKLSGDTLHLRYGDDAVTANCTCESDHSFEIPLLDWEIVKTMKYISFNKHESYIEKGFFKCNGLSTGFVRHTLIQKQIQMGTAY